MTDVANRVKKIVAEHLGVEEAKEYAYGMMNRSGFENKKAQFESIYQKDDAFII